MQAWKLPLSLNQFSPSYWKQILMKKKIYIQNIGKYTIDLINRIKKNLKWRLTKLKIIYMKLYEHNLHVSAVLVATKTLWYIVQILKELPARQIDRW